MVNERGEILAQEKRPYRIQLQGKRAEIDPDLVWKVAAETIRVLLRTFPDERIQGVGISTLLGYVFLDSAGKPVRPAILYLDNRAEEECREASEREDLSPALKRTGRRLTPELLAPQVRWIRKHEAESIERIHRILGLKDYLVFRLTGELGTDFAHLNYSGLYDLAKGQLYPALLSWVGLEKEIFPPSSYPFQIAGSVQQSASQETGIPTGIPVVRGRK
jgi:xylulokinase